MQQSEVDVDVCGCVPCSEIGTNYSKLKVMICEPTWIFWRHGLLWRHSDNLGETTEHAWATEVSLTIATVTKKTEIGPVDGTPDKRMYWSIISDYGLKTGLCEL